MSFHAKHELEYGKGTPCTTNHTERCHTRDSAGRKARGEIAEKSRAANPGGARTRQKRNRPPRYNQFHWRVGRFRWHRSSGARLISLRQNFHRDRHESASHVTAIAAAAGATALSALGTAPGEPRSKGPHQCDVFLLPPEPAPDVSQDPRPAHVRGTLRRPCFRGNR